MCDILQVSLQAVAHGVMGEVRGRILRAIPACWGLIFTHKTKKQCLVPKIILFRKWKLVTVVVFQFFLFWNMYRHNFLLFMRFLVFTECLGLEVLLQLSIFNADQPISLKAEQDQIIYIEWVQFDVDATRIAKWAKHVCTRPRYLDQYNVVAIPYANKFFSETTKPWH